MLRCHCFDMISIRFLKLLNRENYPARQRVGIITSIGTEISLTAPPQLSRVVIPTQWPGLAPSWLSQDIQLVTRAAGPATCHTQHSKLKTMPCVGCGVQRTWFSTALPGAVSSALFSQVRVCQQHPWSLVITSVSLVIASVSLGESKPKAVRR